MVGSKPTVKDKIIQGIDSSAYPKSGNFKVDGITQILNQHKIKPSESIAIGDSRGDLPMFKLAGLTIAINPKGGIEEFVDHIVSDLHQAKDIIAPLTSSQSSPLPFTSTPPN